MNSVRKGVGAPAFSSELFFRRTWDFYNEETDSGLYNAAKGLQLLEPKSAVLEDASVRVLRSIVCAKLTSNLADRANDEEEGLYEGTCEMEEVGFSGIERQNLFAGLSDPGLEEIDEGVREELKLEGETLFERLEGDWKRFSVESLGSHSAKKRANDVVTAIARLAGKTEQQVLALFDGSVCRPTERSTRREFRGEGVEYIHMVEHTILDWPLTPLEYARGCVNKNFETDDGHASNRSPQADLEYLIDDSDAVKLATALVSMTQPSKLKSGKSRSSSPPSVTQIFKSNAQRTSKLSPVSSSGSLASLVSHDSHHASEGRVPLVKGTAGLPEPLECFIGVVARPSGWATPARKRKYAQSDEPLIGHFRPQSPSSAPPDSELLPSAKLSNNGRVLLALGEVYASLLPWSSPKTTTFRAAMSEWSLRSTVVDMLRGIERASKRARICNEKDPKQSEQRKLLMKLTTDILTDLAQHAATATGGAHTPSATSTNAARTSAGSISPLLALKTADTVLGVLEPLPTWPAKLTLEAAQTLLITLQADAAEDENLCDAWNRVASDGGVYQALVKQFDGHMGFDEFTFPPCTSRAQKTSKVEGDREANERKRPQKKDSKSPKPQAEDPKPQAKYPKPQAKYPKPQGKTQLTQAKTELARAKLQQAQAKPQLAQGKTQKVHTPEDKAKTSYGARNAHILNSHHGDSDSELQAARAASEAEARQKMNVPHPIYPGLKNPDSMCYANSVVQVLAYIPEFAALVKECAAKLFHNKRSSKATQQEVNEHDEALIAQEPYVSVLLDSLLNSMRALRRATGVKITSAQKLVELMGAKKASENSDGSLKDKYSIKEEAAADEFLTDLLDVLKDEMQVAGLREKFRDLTIATENTLRVLGPDDLRYEDLQPLAIDQTRLAGWTNAKATEYAVTTLPIDISPKKGSDEFTTKTSRESTKNSHESTTKSHESTKEFHTLEELWNHRLATQRLDSESPPNEQGHRLIESIITRYTQWPKLLFMALSRFTFRPLANITLKDDRPVHYPLILDLREHGAKSLYDLHAVVVHHGAHVKGHYYSLVRLAYPKEGRISLEGKKSFIRFDDTAVTDITDASAMEPYYGRHPSHQKRGDKSEATKAAKERLHALNTDHVLRARVTRNFPTSMSDEELLKLLTKEFTTGFDATPCAQLLVYIRRD